MAEFGITLSNSQLQQPQMQKQNILLTHTQRTITQNPMHTDSTTDQNRQIPNQQTLWDEKMQSSIDGTVEPVRQIPF